MWMPSVAVGHCIKQSRTTTMQVADYIGGRQALVEIAVLTSLDHDGWGDAMSRSALVSKGQEYAQSLIAAAADYPVGTVLEWRDGMFAARTTSADLP